jgi:hypothetical protein
MALDINFLVIGNILLTIGVFGYFTDNLILASICLTTAFIFFVRQLITNYLAAPKAPEHETDIRS